jgi:hypothetical protein
MKRFKSDANNSDDGTENYCQSVLPCEACRIFIRSYAASISHHCAYMRQLGCHEPSPPIRPKKAKPQTKYRAMAPKKSTKSHAHRSKSSTSTKTITKPKKPISIRGMVSAPICWNCFKPLDELNNSGIPLNCRHCEMPQC